LHPASTAATSRHAPASAAHRRGARAARRAEGERSGRSTIEKSRRPPGVVEPRAAEPSAAGRLVGCGHDRPLRSAVAGHRERLRVGGVRDLLEPERSGDPGGLHRLGEPPAVGSRRPVAHAWRIWPSPGWPSKIGPAGRLNRLRAPLGSDHVRSRTALEAGGHSLNFPARSLRTSLAVVVLLPLAVAVSAGAGTRAQRASRGKCRSVGARGEPRPAGEGF
jgi:hypothetical protein